jgi:Tol biopolymer transport system component
MIEISHAQTRRLLSSALDSRQGDRRSLQNEQWAVLQAHLEGCPACREYRDALDGLEKNLRRAARIKRDTTPGPADGLAARVMGFRRRRGTLAARAAAGALALLLAAGLLTGSLSRLAARPDGEPQASSTGAAASTADGPSSPAATATVADAAASEAGAGSFPAVLAYEARLLGEEGGMHANSEIFLLNPGSPPENLTNHPADDTDPAWSPDGEWLAFLSDRNLPGQPELYVMNLTGSRLVQLTSEPDVHWVGPLSWSPDGRRIAVTGLRRDAGEQSWIYLVEVNAPDGEIRPVALAGTRGSYDPEFSASGEWLAYLFEGGGRSGVALRHLPTGEHTGATWPSNPLAVRPLPGAQLDWAFNGTGLTYIAAYPLSVASLEEVPPTGAGSQVWAVSDLNYSTSVVDEFTQTFRIARSSWPGAHRAVTWSPGGSVVYLEDLADARAQDAAGQVNESCQMVQLRDPNFRDGEGRTFTFGGLCVESGLDHASWTSDGRWVVVLGRLPDALQRSLYALRMPGRGERPDVRREPSVPGSPDFGPSSAVLRLADDPHSASLPRVRPSGSSASVFIDPPERNRFIREMPASDLSQRPGGPQGQIAYVVQNNDRSVLVRANPDGTGGQVLLTSPGTMRCPVWAPDGSRLAFVARPSDLDGEPSKPVKDSEELFLLDFSSPGGGTPRQLTNSAALPGVREHDKVDYGCPAWSREDAPGGSQLAAVASHPEGWQLVIVSAASGRTARQPRYLPVGRPAASARPIWSPDGGRIYLAAAPPQGDTARVWAVALPEDPPASLSASELLDGFLPGETLAYALSPDGQNLMLLRKPNGGPVVAQLVRVPVDGSRPVVLPLDVGGLRELRSARLRWSADHTLDIALSAGPLERDKTLLLRFGLRRSLNEGRLLILAEGVDALTSLAWSPDGQWAVYSTESGLWGLDLAAAVQNLAGPTWISPVPVDDLDW